MYCENCNKNCVIAAPSRRDTTIVVRKIFIDPINDYEYFYQEAEEYTDIGVAGIYCSKKCMGTKFNDVLSQLPTKMPKVPSDNSNFVEFFSIYLGEYCDQNLHMSLKKCLCGNNLAEKRHLCVVLEHYDIIDRNNELKSPQHSKNWVFDRIPEDDYLLIQICSNCSFGYVKQYFYVFQILFINQDIDSVIKRFYKQLFQK